MVMVSIPIHILLSRCNRFIIEPLSEGQDIDLLENVVATQRTIIEQVYNTTDASIVPQVWTLYSE